MNYYPADVTDREVSGPPMPLCSECGQEHNGNEFHDRECECEECTTCKDCREKQDENTNT